MLWQLTSFSLCLFRDFLSFSHYCLPSLSCQLSSKCNKNNNIANSFYMCFTWNSLNNTLYGEKNPVGSLCRTFQAHSCLFLPCSFYPVNPMFFLFCRDKIAASSWVHRVSATNPLWTCWAKEIKTNPLRRESTDSWVTMRDGRDWHLKYLKKRSLLLLTRTTKVINISSYKLGPHVEDFLFCFFCRVKYSSRMEDIFHPAIILFLCAFKF